MWMVPSAVGPGFFSANHENKPGIVYDEHRRVYLRSNTFRKTLQISFEPQFFINGKLELLFSEKQVESI